MKQKGRNREASLFRKISIPLAGLLILQTVALLLIVQLIAVNDFKINTQEVISERVVSRKNEIQYNILTSWAKVDIAVEQINDVYGECKAANKDFWEKETQAEFLLANYGTMTAALRQNSTNGVFLILNSSAEFEDFTSGATRWGLGIRDYDCESGYVGSEDLVTVRSPASIQSSLYSADAWWENKYTFTDQNASEFYYNPLREAFLNSDASGNSLGYYSGAYRLEEKDGMEVVSYSVPLIYDGQPYGVFGTEISNNYFSEQLPKNELGEAQNVAYAIAKTDGDGKYTVITESGSYYTRVFGNAKVIEVKDKGNSAAYTFANIQTNVNPLGFMGEFSLYDHDSPFAGEKLVLIGFINSNTLYSSINRFTTIFILSAIGTFVISIVCVVLISKIIADPIKKLAGKVRKFDAGDDITLNHLGVAEIDGLISSIEQMHDRIAENLAKTEFFARMSHDMRTPMNAIMGFSDENIVGRATEEEKLLYFNKINASGKYLLSLINDVLDMSKINSGKLNLFYENVKFRLLWDSTLPIIEEIAATKGVHFVVEGLTEEQKELTLSIDRYRMQQIFTNLLSNSVKFTEKGKVVTFRINELGRDEKKIKFEYTVEDTGCGMDEAFLKKLYLPFQQERPGEGTGLGLSIAKNLVEILGGTIDCKSVVGQGTVFTVVMEHNLAEKPQEEKVVSGKLDNRKILSGRKVLLCEDNILNRQIAELQLTQMGMKVEHAGDGVIAVKMFEKSEINYYDVILMDIHMPHKNGLDAARDIRALPRADATSVPIIAMTANAFAEDIIASEQAGMNHHIVKPISPTKLYDVLASYLSKKES